MKKTISILAAFAAFAVFGVTPNTEWQDVPGTDKVGEVLSSGGAVITEADPVWNAQKGGYQPKLVSGTNIKTVNGNSLLGNGNVEVKSGDGLTTNAVLDIIHRTVDGSARPLPRYLHALDFDDSYPEAAAEYYRSRGDGKTDGGCSSVRDGGFLYRNFDYPFDDRAEFVVKMSAGKDRFASVGVAQVGTNLTEQMVTSGKPSRCYKWLPGATVDGINENGVVCNINVVDGNPQTSGWHTGGDIHPLAAVRWALDNGTSAGMVASNLALRIAFPQGWTQNFHYMIADERETWIVEDGAFVSTGTTYRRPPLTNCGVVDRVLIYPDIVRFVYDPLSPSIGEGMERLHTLLEGASITNVWYTRAYRRETNPPWVSDLAEVIDYTNDIFNAWAAHDKEYFRGQLNGGKPWWQSIHTSIYDLTNRTLRIAVQEQDDWYTFAVPASGAKVDAYTKSETDAIAHRLEEVVLTDQYIDNEEYETREVRVSVPCWRHDSFDRSVLRTHDRWNMSDAATVAITNALYRYIDTDCLDPVSMSSIYVYSREKSTGLFSEIAIAEFHCRRRVFGEGTFDYDVHVETDVSGGPFSVLYYCIRTTTSDDGIKVEVSDNGGEFETIREVVFDDLAPASMIDASNPTFSNAVVNVRLPFGYDSVTNAVAMLNDFKAAFGDLGTGDIVGGVGTIGTIILALLGAAAYLKKKTSLLENNGKASDDFATDLLGKQVAISAMKYGLVSTSATVKAADRTVTKVTLGTTAVTVTFPDADENGKTRDFLLRIDAATFATGGSLTITKPTGATIYGDAFPSPEAAKQYLVAITETAANEFYVRTIEITEPTEG